MNLELSYIETEAHGAVSESLDKDFVARKRLNEKTRLTDYGMLMGPAALEQEGAKPMGNNVSHRRIFSVRSVNRKFLDSEFVNLKKHDIYALRGILAAGVVKHHATYGDARTAVSRALNLMAGPGNRWTIREQRPVKV